MPSARPPVTGLRPRAGRGCSAAPTHKRAAGKSEPANRKLHDHLPARARSAFVPLSPVVILNIGLLKYRASEVVHIDTECVFWLARYRKIFDSVEIRR